MEVNAQNAEEVARITREFLKPFDETEIKLKPAMVKNNRALVLAFIDARLVLDRLDEVVGINNWRDEYQLLPGGEVECRLSVRIAGEWITKSDVGGQSEQPDDGDKMKAAFSDALKRAAVKFGVGRFLYRRPQQWMDYDPVKKQIIRPAQGQGQRQQQKPPPVSPPQSQAPPASPFVQPTEKAISLAKRFDAAGSRAAGAPVYQDMQTWLDAGGVSATDKAHVDAALKRFAERHPKQKDAPAKA